MPRAPRIHEPGSYRHVTARGNAGSALFLDDEDRWRFLGLLAEVTRSTDWRCLGWCLLTTHYHLLVQEGDRPLAKAMHALHSRYVGLFNARHDRRGHVFGGRYHVATLTDDAHLISAIRYVARNPVEAGICANPAEWCWSSYRELVGAAPPLSFLSRAHVLALFSPRRATAIELARRFVESVPGTTVPGTWLQS